MKAVFSLQLLLLLLTLSLAISANTHQSQLTMVSERPLTFMGYFMNLGKYFMWQLVDVYCFTTGWLGIIFLGDGGNSYASCQADYIDKFIMS